MARGAAACSYGRKRLIEYLERFERWEEVLELAETHYLVPTDKQEEQIKRERLMGVANFELGRAVDFGVVLGRSRSGSPTMRQAKELAATEAREKAESEKKDKKAVDKAGSDAAGKFKRRIDAGKRAVEEFEVYAKISGGEGEAERGGAEEGEAGEVSARATCTSGWGTLTRRYRWPRRRLMGKRTASSRWPAMCMC